ncbi:MAG: hypothetical protein ACOCV2_13865 [Persicimonas sp.]
MILRSAKSILLASMLLFSVLLYGCERFSSESSTEDRESPSEAAEDDRARQKADKEPTEEDFAYSPFFLELEGGEFDTVSFKDVGLERVDGEPDELMLEAVAESLAYELSERSDETGYEAEMAYDEKMADPSNHVHCGLNHLYIDLWQSESPDRWGYSLWSGCSEIDKFASDELPDEHPDADAATQVEPLTESIVDDVVDASEEECFQAQC